MIELTNLLTSLLLNRGSGFNMSSDAVNFLYAMCSSRNLSVIPKDVLPVDATGILRITKLDCSDSLVRGGQALRRNHQMPTPIPTTMNEPMKITPFRPSRRVCGETSSDTFLPVLPPC